MAKKKVEKKEKEKVESISLKDLEIIVNEDREPIMEVQNIVIGMHKEITETKEILNSVEYDLDKVMKRLGL